MPQYWRLDLDGPPEETIDLPVSPANAVIQVAVKDGEATAQPVDPSTYEFAPGSPGRLRRAAPWPTPGVITGGVSIEFAAGYADAATVPAELKQAALMLAAHFYEAREAAGENRLFTVPQTIDALIAPYRVVRL